MVTRILALVVSSAALAVGCGSDGAESGQDVSGEGTPDGDAAVDHARPAWPTGPASTPGPTDAGSGGVDTGSVPAAVLRCTGKLGAEGERSITLKVGGVDRTMIVHVPPKYDPMVGASLVFNFHGFLMTGAQERDVSLMNATSDARGFVVVYPDGTGGSWNAGACCGSALTGNVDDVGFVKMAIDTIAAEWCIDPKRIYATGFSNGGFLSHRLACEMSDTFAAIAPVSGVLGKDPASCNPSRPVSVIEFHGTSDVVVPFNGGVPLSPIDFGGAASFRSVTQTVDFWRAKNDCLGGGTVYAAGDASCVRYNCSAGTKVEFCTIDGGGHAWPGGTPIPIPGAGKTSTDIKASEQIADFFEAHPLP